MTRLPAPLARTAASAVGWLIFGVIALYLLVQGLRTFMRIAP